VQTLVEGALESSLRPVDDLGNLLVPPDEERRMCTLRSCGILGTPETSEFDSITALAKKMFNVEMCFVSLVDQDRQWFKSHQGLASRETPRSLAFCSVVVYISKTLVVLDAKHDERFSDNELVTGAPFIRFYAGAPVQVEGSVMGTLCILDTKPREAFSPEEVDLLEHMAVLVEHAVMQHKESVIMNQEKQRLRPLIAESTAPVFGMDTAGICNEWNSKAEQVLGFAANDVIGRDFFQTLCPPGEDEAYMRGILKTAQDFQQGDESICTVMRTANSQKNVDMILSCAPRFMNATFSGMVFVGQNMDTLGGALPQIPRSVLAHACSVAAHDDPDTIPGTSA